MANEATFALTQETALVAGIRFPVQETSAATRTTSATFALMGGLVPTAVTINTGDQAGAVGVLHLATISGLTAARSWTTPATAQVGEMSGVYCVTDASTTIANVLRTKTPASSGNKIDGVDHSTNVHLTLLSRGELVIYQCVDAAGPHWITHRRQLIQSACRGYLASVASNYYTQSTAVLIPCTTKDYEVGGIFPTAANKYVSLRRAGIYRFGAACYIIGVTSAAGLAIFLQSRANATPIQRVSMHQGAMQTTAGDRAHNVSCEINVPQSWIGTDDANIGVYVVQNDATRSAHGASGGEFNWMTCLELL